VNSNRPVNKALTAKIRRATKLPRCFIIIVEN
jgi:hypothetical protein